MPNRLPSRLLLILNLVAGTFIFQAQAASADLANELPEHCARSYPRSWSSAQKINESLQDLRNRGVGRESSFTSSVACLTQNEVRSLVDQVKASRELLERVSSSVSELVSRAKSSHSFSYLNDLVTPPMVEIVSSSDLHNILRSYVEVTADPTREQRIELILRTLTSRSELNVEHLEDLLETAVRVDDPRTLRRLFELPRMRKASELPVSMYGETHLTTIFRHHYRTESRLALAQVLIEFGADINQIGFAGHTPLTFAVREGEIELVRYFLSIPGIQVNKKTVRGDDREGFTALELAEMGNFTEIAQVLRNFRF